MLLTRKATSSAVPQNRLARGLSGVLAKTMDRRAFLRRSGITVGAGGAATAAAVVATKSGTRQPAPASKDKRATRGYQSSEHVNNYYRTAKV